jgi:predicted DCC family thiol-disulfide oxidoreductase YuxK
MNKPFNKALLYDDNCPLCKAYTNAFVQTGFLQQKNRIAFSEINTSQFDIDWKKARHEIPLIDRDTGQVLYGIDALVNILQQKCVCIGWLIRVKPRCTGF